MSMPAVLAGSSICKRFPRRRTEAEGIVEFAIGKKPSVGGRDRAAKLQRQTAVKIEPERPSFEITAGLVMFGATIRK